MGVFVRTAVVVGLALVVPAAVWVYGSIERPAATRAAVAPGPAPPPAPGDVPRPVGSAGCAAAACHGGSPAASLTAPPGPTCWQTSATHWLAADPHTRAYAALQTPLAKDIVRLMAGTDEQGNPRPHEPAERDDRCLACHTNPYLVSANAKEVGGRMVGLRSEGVGCEACHGNASKWYEPHTGTDWNPGTRAAKYHNHGMAPLYDVGERALVCAGCHVGAPAEAARGYPVRDMNHDMIAAGHPRLNFDFADYQRRLPPHWQEKDRLAASPAPRGPAFEVKCWLVGRVATAEAACRLTEDRAKRLDPWPEFAESNCFACHHELVPGNWRQTTRDYYRGRSPGAAPWQTIWPVTSEGALAGVPAVATPAAVADLKALLAVVESPRSAPGPVRGAAGKAAGSLAALRAELAGLPDGAAAAAALKSFDPLRQGAALLDWDTAAQAYLGAAAVERARLGLNPAARENPAFRPAFDRLKFPRTDDRTGEKMNSPRGLDPAATREGLKVLFGAVPTDWPPR
jgi:hypothetical protein